MKQTIAVLGAGAWGTAIAIHLHRRHNVRVWARDADHAGALVEARVNQRYLPGVELSPDIVFSADFNAVLTGATVVFVATPVAALVETTRRLKAAGVALPLACLGKGFVVPAAGHVLLPHQAVADYWTEPIGVVSGPSFAEEVARGLPTALTAAANDANFARSLANLAQGDALRLYVSDDLIGVEIGGAMKNVMAIAAGASDGLGFGGNARAALITRGLAEMSRLAVAMGGKRETLMGLAGLGDLVLTCTGDLSRNRRVGLGLAQGRPLGALLAELGHVAEGVTAAEAAMSLAAKYRVDLPICSAVHDIVKGVLSPRAAVELLLRREPRAET